MRDKVFAFYVFSLSTDGTEEHPSFFVFDIRSRVVSFQVACCVAQYIGLIGSRLPERKHERPLADSMDVSALSTRLDHKWSD